MRSSTTSAEPGGTPPAPGTTHPSPPAPAAQASPRRDAARQLVRTARRAATAYGREDLAARLGDLDEQLADPTVTAVVLGEFKAGKSSLVNALLGADVCPVDADVATEVPTVVRYAPEPVARGIQRDDGDPARGDASPAVVLEAIPPAEVAAAISAQGSRWRTVEIGVPRRLLEAGLVLIDTPGAGGLDARHLADALGVLAAADTVLFAVDAANELGGPSLELLAQVTDLCPTVMLVLTKADLYHHVAQILEANRDHLARAGLDVSMLVTSAELRQHALATGDRAIDAESGLTELSMHLLGLVARADDLAAQRAARAVNEVAEQLGAVFEAEAAALAAPAKAASTPSPPRSTAQPGWQQMLGDDTADLNADVDHEVRRRSRALIAEAEEALAEGDPAELWPEVSAWLEERAAADVVAIFALLRERALAMAERIATRFEATEGSGAPVDAVALEELSRTVLAALPERAALDPEASSKTSTGLNALRSSFYGFLMFSTLGALVGVAAAPAALVLGVVIGGKAVRDERGRSKQQRRVQAKGAVRSYVDEVAFTTSKEVRDALRNVGRALRDHFTALAAEQQRSAAEAATAAQRAAVADAAQREQRSRDVAAELRRIGELARRADALAADVSPEPSPDARADGPATGRSADLAVTP